MKNKKIALALIVQTLSAQDLSFQVSATLATSYFTRPGFIEKGPVVQNYAGINYKGFTLFTWGNENLAQREETERDTGITYTFEDILGITPRMSYQAWTYPESIDYVAELGIHKKSVIDLDATVTALLPGSDADPGVMFHTTISKPIPLGKKLTLTPRVKAAVLTNFYDQDGFGHITPGLEVNLKLGSIKATAFGEYRFGIANGYNAGLSLSYSFTNSTSPSK